MYVLSKKNKLILKQKEMKKLTTLLMSTFLFTGITVAQEFKAQFFTPIVIQSSQYGDASSPQLGDFYKKNEMGFSVSYENNIRPNGKWLFISRLRMSQAKYTYISKNTRESVTSTETVENIFSVQKTSLHVGVGRRFNIEKIGLEITPHVLFASRMSVYDGYSGFSEVHQMKNGAKVNTSSLDYRFEVKPFVYLNFGVDITKNLTDKLKLGLTIDYGYNDKLEFKIDEKSIIDYGQPSETYSNSLEGDHNTSNIHFGLGLSYDLR